jgi:alpha-tubulin suppressor-like RCC1 family protein/sugar lactone lactonase YvrE
MANKTINELQNLTTLSGNSLLPIYQNLSTYSTRLIDIENTIVNNINLNSKVSAYFDPTKKYSVPLANNTVTNSTIVSNAINSDKLSSNSVTTDKLASNSVTSDKLAANSVTTDKLVANSVTSDKLAANSVTSDKLISNSVTSDKLAANSVTSDKLISNSVTSDKLAANVIKPNGRLSKTSEGLSLSNDDAVSKYVLVYDGSNWIPRRIDISDFGSINTTTGELYPANANIIFDSVTKSWVATAPEKTLTVEQSYIRNLASCQQAGGNYAAITNDNRVIAWGNLNKEKFGGTTTQSISATSNVRVPFWNNYDGYKDTLSYIPYGGDYLDENPIASVGPILWNSTNGTALIYTTDDINLGGDVWVCGTNGGTASAVYADPTSIAISNDGDGYVLTENAKTTQSTLTRIVPEIDFRDMNALSAVPKSKHIIPNKYVLGDGSVTPNISLSSVKEQYYFSYAHGVKFVDSLGNITDIAGSPTISNASTQKGGMANNMPGVSARFSTPDGIAQSSNGMIYVCDTGNHNIKRIQNTATRNTAVIAGIAAENGALVQTGNADGRTTDARFNQPRKIVIDPTDNKIMYVSDSHRIRKLSVTALNEPNELWDVTTVAGASALGGIVNGIGTNARFNTPVGLALNKTGTTLYIADSGNKCIRTFNTSTSAVDTFVTGTVNTAAKFNRPLGIFAQNSTTLYATSFAGNDIRKITIDPITKAGTVTKFVGNNTAGSVNAATLTGSSINGPLGITILNNKMYISEHAGNYIRMIDLSMATPAITTVAGTGAATSTDSLTGTKGTVYKPVGITSDGSRYLYFVDYATAKIRRIDTSTNRYALSTIAGTGTAGGADNIDGTKATFNGPAGLTYHAATSSLYVADSLGHIIRRINLSTNPHSVTTIAGLYNTAGNVNSDIGINARFKGPYGLISDSNYLYVCDASNHTIRRITLTPPYKVETIIGSGVAGTNFGDGSIAKLNDPRSIAVIDNVAYIGCDSSHIIAKASLSSPYALSSFAGTIGSAGNDNSGTAVIDWTPYGLAMDDNDILYFTDTSGDRIGSIDTTSPNKEITFFRKFPIGNMGIGAMTNKATAGFIKTLITENGVEVKFKSVKRKGTTNILFAALDINDSLWVWGTAMHGAFGIGHGAASAAVTLPPTKVKRFAGQIKDYEISCSDATSAVISIITKDGKMYAAGTNINGQLARGYTSVAAHTHREFKFEECRKTENLITSIVTNANSLANILYAGSTNNAFVDTDGQVWICGNNTYGLLGDGTEGNTNQNTFTKVNNLTNIKKVVINGKDKPTIFALANDGKLYSWGYNGAAKGQTLTNEITLNNIKQPARCWNFDKKSEVDNAIDIFGSDNTAADQTLMAYIDANKYAYFGGYRADVAGPDFADNIPYFKRFNVKNVTSDILISGEEAFVHKENGTTYQVKSIGPQKIF